MVRSNNRFLHNYIYKHMSCQICLASFCGGIVSAIVYYLVHRKELDTKKLYYRCLGTLILVSILVYSTHSVCLSNGVYKISKDLILETGKPKF
jgi:hypothetical protein